MSRWILLVLGLSSCCAPSEKAFRSRGEGLVKEMVCTLQDIQNHEELQMAAQPLKKQFKQLAFLLLEIREFRKSHPDYAWKGETLAGSEALFAQLARLYEIPGCREMIEQFQAEAVNLLLRQ